MIGQRENWANRAEKTMLDEGIDAEFVLAGNNKDRLTVKWALMGRVAVHKITNDGSLRDGDFLAQMQKVGFRRVTFTDGFNYSVYYDLKPSDVTTAGNAVLEAQGIGAPLQLQ